METTLQRGTFALLLMAVWLAVSGCYGWGPHHAYGGRPGHDSMGMDGPRDDRPSNPPQDAPCRGENGKERPCPER